MTASIKVVIGNRTYEVPRMKFRQIEECGPLLDELNTSRQADDAKSLIGVNRMTRIALKILAVALKDPAVTDDTLADELEQSDVIGLTHSLTELLRISGLMEDAPKGEGAAPAQGA